MEDAGRGSLLPVASCLLPAVVLTMQSHNRQVVAACCELARQAGIRPDMTLAHARALLGGAPVHIGPLEPAGDRRRLDALAQWAMRRFSPLVQVDERCSPGQGGLMMDITGCQRLFGGEENLLAQVAQAVGRLGFAVRVASADTIGCAWAVARYGAADRESGRRRQDAGTRGRGENSEDRESGGRRGDAQTPGRGENSDRGIADRETADGGIGSDGPPASPTAGLAVTSRSSVAGQRSSVNGPGNSGDRHIFANDAKTSQSPLDGQRPDGPRSDGPRSSVSGPRPSVNVVPPGGQLAVMKDLPAGALRLDAKTVAGLAEVGLRKVGQIVVLSPRVLRERFGPEICQRIDQVTGGVWEHVQGAKPLSVPQVELILGGPICNMEAIKLGVRNLLGQLLQQLDACQLGVRRLEVTLVRSDAGPVTLAAPLAYPSCNEKHLWTLLCPAVESANMGFGVEVLRMAAVDTAPLAHTQMVLLPQVISQRSSKQMHRCMGELVDVLASRLGSPAVTCVSPVESHVPERAFERQEARESRPGESRIANRQSRVKKQQQRESQVAAGGSQFLSDRPSILLEHPEQVKVTSLSPDGPVVSFWWRGNWTEVLTCAGPERIAPQWWRAEERRGDAQTPRRGESGEDRGIGSDGLPASPTSGAVTSRSSVSGQRSSVNGQRSSSQRGQAPFPDGNGGNGASPLAARDYFKLQDQHGQWIWLFRRRSDNAWFVHGLWQ